MWVMRAAHCASRAVPVRDDGKGPSLEESESKALQGLFWRCKAMSRPSQIRASAPLMAERKQQNGEGEDHWHVDVYPPPPPRNLPPFVRPVPLQGHQMVGRLNWMSPP